MVIIRLPHEPKPFSSFALTRYQHDADHDTHGISSSANMEPCHCVSVVGTSSSSSSSACSSVLWLMRAYMTRLSDIAHNIASFTVRKKKPNPRESYCTSAVPVHVLFSPSACVQCAQVHSVSFDNFGQQLQQVHTLATAASAPRRAC